MRESLGRYRILEPLGEGGMGKVFLAEDPALGRRVAIKVLPTDVASDPDRRARLLAEARAASALNHPSILTIFDVGEDGGVLFVAMERIDGKTLRAWSAATPRRPAEVLAVVRQAAGALAVAHRAGLVHRDLKPDNVMVRDDGLVKILDFGLARSVVREAGDTRTMPGTVMGSAPYMSPEQVLGQEAVPASDVFALAIVSYELLTGTHPFAGSASEVETMHRILHETPKPPSRLRDGLSAQLDFVLAKALAKEASRRYVDAGAFDVDLETAERSLASDGAAPGAGARAGDGAPAGPRSLAVLPFKNIGGNPDLNYLGVGLADAVITRLSESPDLIVRSTSTIARYENQPVDPMRVAQELQTTAVLDASFQRQGERFRATARLVGAPGGQSLWAGKVDLRFEDIFDVQDEVARGIAEALTARLTSDASRSAARNVAPTHEAYEAYMRGKEAVRAANREGYLAAMEFHKQAIALAPGYVDAWASLANAYHAIADGGFDPDPAWYVRAEEAAARALAIDPDHPLARFQAAALHLVRGQKIEAYRGFVHAIRAMPNQWAPRHYLAYVFRLCDRFEEAVEQETTAIALDPTVPWPHPVGFRLLVRLERIEEARAALDLYRTSFPQGTRRWELEFLLLLQENRLEELLDLAARNDVTLESGAGPRFELALAMLKTGRGESADHILELFAPPAAADMDYAAFAASLAAEAGRSDLAFEHLARATELGNDMLRHYETPLFYGKLFDDPRWPPFIEGVKQRNARDRAAMPWPVEGVKP